MYGKHLWFVFPLKIKRNFLQVFEEDQRVKVLPKMFREPPGQGPEEVITGKSQNSVVRLRVIFVVLTRPRRQKYRPGLWVVTGTSVAVLSDSHWREKARCSPALEWGWTPRNCRNYPTLCRAWLTPGSDDTGLCYSTSCWMWKREERAITAHQRLTFL